MRFETKKLIAVRRRAYLKEIFPARHTDVIFFMYFCKIQIEYWYDDTYSQSDIRFRVQVPHRG